MDDTLSRPLTAEEEEAFQEARRAAIEMYGEDVVVASEEAFDVTCLAFEAAEGRHVA